MNDELNPEQQTQRWYDRHKTVSKSVKLLETFPLEIQAIIADGIVMLAERECQAHELLANLRSLGPEKVLGIYKSKNRRRSYDRNSTVHEAMNYLYILSEENRLFIANQVIELVNFIYDYLKSCRQYKLDARTDDVAELTKTYIESGAADAQQLLEQLQQRFSTSITEAITKGEELFNGEAGMKIRDERSRD